ncbi:MAG: protein kinase family protein [Planctomycetaceae bacterium]|nr:protein kinase family protein [Planctomycetaceae bacterium]
MKEELNVQLTLDNESSTCGSNLSDFLRLFPILNDDFPSSNLSEGEVVGNYRMIRKLSRKHEASVWLAEHTSRRGSFFVGKQSRNAEREAIVLSHLQHSGIPQFVEVVQTSSGSEILITRYNGEKSVSEYLSEFGVVQRVFAIQKLIKQVYHIVQYLHEKAVIHCDIKPDNIVVDQFGNAVLIDFEGARSSLDVGSIRVTRRFLNPTLSNSGYEDVSTSLSVWNDYYSLLATYVTLLDECEANAIVDVLTLGITRLFRLFCFSPHPQSKILKLLTATFLSGALSRAIWYVSLLFCLCAFSVFSLSDIRGSTVSESDRRVSSSTSTAQIDECRHLASQAYNHVKDLDFEKANELLGLLPPDLRDPIALELSERARLMMSAKNAEVSGNKVDPRPFMIYAHKYWHIIDERQKSAIKLVVTREALHRNAPPGEIETINETFARLDRSTQVASQ